jgi:hypothetical protein
MKEPVNHRRDSTHRRGSNRRNTASFEKEEVQSFRVLQGVERHDRRTSSVTKHLVDEGGLEGRRSSTQTKKTADGRRSSTQPKKERHRGSIRLPVSLNPTEGGEEERSKGGHMQRHGSVPVLHVHHHNSMSTIRHRETEKQIMVPKAIESPVDITSKKQLGELDKEGDLFSYTDP